jgi:hypothetical protein
LKIIRHCMRHARAVKRICTTLLCHICCKTDHMKTRSDKNPILHRILQKAGDPGLFDSLASKMTLSDLQSLLLEVYRKRTDSIDAADLVRQYKQNRFVKPSRVNPSAFAELDLLAFSLLPGSFETLELAPAGPLGACSALGPVDQNNVLTTIRNTEVLSDPTNIMAIECAVRRKNSPDRSAAVKLCCSHRVARAQFVDAPASFAHFRLLSLCGAGRDTGSRRFETASLVEHADYYLRLLGALNSKGYSVSAVRVKWIALSDGIYDLLKMRIVPELYRQHTNAVFEIERDSGGRGGYYRSARFQVYAKNHLEEEFFIADGGMTDWTQKLLNDRKERLIISGMGTERFIFCFARKLFLLNCLSFAFLKVISGR